ncbi:MAG TPA: ATP-dependent RecD-like DNA helicase [Chloroflexota bacterium]|nr:ATP-dependent RecD-like DNA helicase [Chloroflexota bacterium]
MQQPSVSAVPSAIATATLEGTLERVTYVSEESGYTVARLAPARGGDLVTVVGNLAGANPGESLRLHGRWTTHAHYGRQFTIEHYSTVLPATIQGIRKYLGSGLIKGIGPVTAERIVATLGTDALRVIEEEPERLLTVPGLGKVRQARIVSAWAEQRAIKEVMLFLQEVGVSTSIAVRIYKQYRDEAIRVVREEPYRLAADVWGIGFKTADAIAAKLGMAHDAPARLRAGLAYTLSEATDDGHCSLPEAALRAQAATILGVDPPSLAQPLADLQEEEGAIAEIIEGVTQVYLPPFYHAEVALARRLDRLLGARDDRLRAFQAVDWTRAFAWLNGKGVAALAPEQAEAVRLALTERVAVLTGGPGTGKSTTTRAIVLLARAKGARVLLAAPTGRAARRLGDLAGLPAVTLHRLLELRPGGQAAYDQDRPLEADLIVVDEVSMLDLLLANALVRAVPPGAHLLLVGDADQLPSVGPGEVLRDLLESGAVPRVQLTQVFRQAAESGVVTNAHRINRGEMPITRGLPDFFLFVEEDPERAADLVVDLVARRMPARFGLDPLRDVQVLPPMHRGAVGVGTLNERLQEALNPARAGLAERRFGSRVFRVGDRVLQLRNDHEKKVYNGSAGQVTAIDLERGVLRARMDEEDVEYDFGELDELTHAYAMSVHKAQGSEYPAVVVPLLTTHFPMLQRNLFYTAVTRARRLVVLVGTRRALAIAVRTAGTGKRHTALAWRLARQHPATGAVISYPQREQPLARVAEADAAYDDSAQ